MANITFYHNRFIKVTITLGKQRIKLSVVVAETLSRLYCAFQLRKNVYFI